MKDREIRIKLTQSAYEKVERQAILHDTKPATLAALFLMERINAAESQAANVQMGAMFAKMIEEMPLPEQEAEE